MTKLDLNLFWYLLCYIISNLCAPLMIIESYVCYIQTETSASFLEKTLNAEKLAVAIAVPVGTGLTSASIQTVLVVICKEQTYILIYLYTNIMFSLRDYHVGTLRLKHTQCLPIYLENLNETGLTPKQLIVEIYRCRLINYQA